MAYFFGGCCEAVDDEVAVEDVDMPAETDNKEGAQRVEDEMVEGVEEVDRSEFGDKAE